MELRVLTKVFSYLRKCTQGTVKAMVHSLLIHLPQLLQTLKNSHFLLFYIS